MIKKILIAIFIVFNLLALVYLITPTPVIPDLVNSVKSDLPGDTTQISNVSGYFTNMSRTEAMNFYKAYYTGFFRINLNHPPEKAKDIIVNTIPSYYFEELVLPFKESLYINGFEWENDVFTKPENRIKNKIIYQGKEYKSKITIRRFPTSVPKRLTAFFVTEAGIIFALYTFKTFVFKKKS
jgi:hypothetical protein